MAVSTRIAVIAVGDRFRHDEAVGWAVLHRLRERAAFRPFPPGTVLAECGRAPG
jgi:hydrogenase maturation protease